MKILLNNLKRLPTKEIPVWFMRQAGRHLPEYLELRKQNESFLDFCYNPKNAAIATLQPIQRYDIDAAILFSDILVIPDALGQKVSFKKQVGPILEEFSLTNLSMHSIESHLSPIMETIDRVKAALPPEKTFIGFCGAPWTVATYMIQGSGMRESEGARLYAYQHKDEFLSLLNLLVEASFIYLSAQIKAGVDVVQIFDSWAGVLDEASFIDFCLKPTQKLVQLLKAAHPETPIIGFPRGVGQKVKQFVMETKVDAVSLDQTVSLEWAARELQPHVCVQGNLDNQQLVAGGTGLLQAADNIINAWGKNPFVFNLSHGITPNTPIQHVEAVITHIRQTKRD